MADGEVLVRLVFHPEHLNPDGSLKPSAIPKRDLERPHPDAVPPSGWSLVRVGLSTDDELETKALVIQAGSPENRAEVWLFKIGCQDLRAIQDATGVEGVCVVDRALPDDHSHAEAWGARTRTKSEIGALRLQILDALERGRRVA